MNNLSINNQVPILYKKGSIVFVEGQKALHLYIVLSGKIGVLKETKDRLLLLSVIGEDDFLGELSMFDNSPRSATAVALEDTQVLMVAKSDISRILETGPSWIKNIMLMLSERLKNANEILREHRIVDESLNTKLEIQGREELAIRKSINSFRENLA